MVHSISLLVQRGLGFRALQKSCGIQSAPGEACVGFRGPCRADDGGCIL